jgi:preprotein translocase subunit SecE
VAIQSTKGTLNANKKNIYITFISIGVVAWFPISSLMFNIFDLVSTWVPNPKLLGTFELSNLVSAAISALIVMGLVQSKAIYAFTNDVFVELGKVSWPIKKGTGISWWEKFREIRESTMVVILSIAALGIIIGAMDMIFQVLVKIVF